MNALLFERPVRFATGALILEEAEQMEDFTYHRPVLAEEVVELQTRGEVVVCPGKRYINSHTATESTRTDTKTVSQRFLCITTS